MAHVCATSASATSSLKIQVERDDPEFGTKLANHLKLHFLLERAEKLLRKVFRERWRIYANGEWDDDVKSHCEHFIYGCGEKIFNRLGKIQKASVVAGNIDEWDITTLTDLLIFTEFDKFKSSQYREENLKLESLKKVRNKTAHNPRFGLNDQDFEELWEKTRGALLYFGDNNDEINKLKVSTIIELEDIEAENNAKSKVSEENSKLANKLILDANNLCEKMKFVEAVNIYTMAINLEGISEFDLATLHASRSAAYIGAASDASAEIRIGIKISTELALDDAKKVMKLRPAWYRGYNRAGTAYFKLKKYEKARRCFDCAFNLAPAREDILHARDECRQKLGEYAENQHLDLFKMPETEEEAIERGQKIYGTSIDPKKLKEQLLQAEKLFPGQSDVNQGHRHRDGDGAPQSDELAAKFYTKAASFGNAEGLYNLAILYKTGKGVKRDFKMYIKLLKEAITKPLIHCEFNVSNIGVADAENSFGTAHEHGIGVPQDCSKAAEWYKKSSDHGYSMAACNLGMLYIKGRGVPKDWGCGFQYWKLAASQNNVLAMRHLTTHYLDLKEPEHAKYWHKLAITNGSLDAKLDEEEFDAKFCHLVLEKQKVEKKVSAMEAKAGIVNLEKLNLGERVERMMDVVNPEVAEIIKEFKTIIATSREKSNPVGIASNYDGLSEYAARGSITAQKMLIAKEHFYKAMSIFSNNPNNLPEFLHEFANCCRIEQLVIAMPKSCMDNLLRIVATKIKMIPQEPPSELDKDARICYTYLNFKNFEETLGFVEASKLKYKDEIFFHKANSDLYAFLGKFEVSLKVVDEALKMFPRDTGLLFNRAGMMSFIPDLKPAEVIQVYKDFLSTAPKDHRQAPDAYYAIGSQYHRTLTSKGRQHGSKTKSLKIQCPPEAREYYKLGIQAEQIQLHYFLPYESTNKLTLVNVLRMFHLKNNKLPSPN